MIYRLIALILSAVIGLGGYVPASAGEDVDAVLRGRGYPELVIKYMDARGKAELADKVGYRFSDAKLVHRDGGSVTAYDDEDEVSLPERPGLVTLWVASVRRLPGGSAESAFVQMCYNWMPLPLFRGRDAVTAEWDTSAMRLRDGSFYKIDSYDGTLLDDNGRVVTSYADVMRDGSAEYEDTASGIRWTARLGGFTGLVLTGLRGYARFTLAPSEVFDGSVTVACGYSHRVLFGGSAAPDCGLEIAF